MCAALLATTTAVMPTPFVVHDNVARSLESAPSWRYTIEALVLFHFALVLAISLAPRYVHRTPLLPPKPQLGKAVHPHHPESCPRAA